MRISSCTRRDRSRTPVGRQFPRSEQRHHRWVAACSSAAGVALIVAGCSSGTNAAGSGNGTAGSAGGASVATPTGRVLAVAGSGAGSFLVDATGKAVYVFAIDKAGHSACTATCLQYWPAVKAPKPLPATLPGVAAKLGELNRPDGVSQLTVNGYPVYTYAGDTAPGSTRGQGKNLSGGLWWIVAPDGKWITTPAAGGSSSGTSNGSATKDSSGNGY